MKILLSISGYLFAVGASYFAYNQFQQIEKLQQQINDYSTQTAQISKDVKEKNHQCLAYEQEITELKSSLLRSNNELNNMYLNIDEFQETINSEYQQLLDQVLQEAVSGEVSDRMERHLTPDMSKSMAKMQVNSLYNEYLNKLDTYDVRKEEIRQLLIDSLVNRSQISRQVALGEITYSEAAELIGPDSITNALSAILTEHELEQFDDYQETQISRQFRSTYEPQLTMMAPNLSEQSKELVLDALVTEMTSIQNEYVDMNDAQSVNDLQAMFSSNYDHQSEAIENARNTLNFQLDGQDMEQVDEFFDQLMNQQTITRQMNE